MNKKHWIMFIVWIGLGVWTLLPIPGASKPCLIGYYAHCTFTPISTVMCFVAAAIVYWRGRRKGKETTK
ncbi:hypothetical protein ACSFC1_10375 [Pseudothermotoga sp. U03pept]|uniref:hypothetical protein n=1 Tax=Pseudothermotoga sp. U03pept TaxID=3447012 RepID=UPI003F0BA8E6